MISFTVEAEPVSKGSTNAFWNPRTGRMQVAQVNRERLQDFETRVRLAARAAGVRISAAPLEVGVTCYLARPASHFSRSTGRLLPSAPEFPDVVPDVDKLLRAALDGLTGVAYVDDAQVVDAPLCKRYAQEGQEPGLLVTIEELGPPRKSRLAQLEKLQERVRPRRRRTRR